MVGVDFMFKQLSMTGLMDVTTSLYSKGLPLPPLTHNKHNFKVLIDPSNSLEAA